MRRRSFITTIVTLLVAVSGPAHAFAQTQMLAQSAQPWDGGGGYLSWWKLLLIGIVFLIWVKLADWVNRDSMNLGEDTGLKPEFWNPITMLSFLAGFFAAISIPIFLAGYPLLVIAAFVPPIAYSVMRRSEIAKNPGLKSKASSKPGVTAAVEVLPQDEGPEISFTAAGDGTDQQVNQIRARQTPEDGFNSLKLMVDECLRARADQALLDYTRDRVAIRMQIDGAWHPLPPMDRTQGDALLASLKYLGGLNPAERKAAQSGKFRLKTREEKLEAVVSSTGVATGERVQLRFIRKSKGILSPVQLGMFPDMEKKVISLMNNEGMSIVSAMPGTGLSTSWQSLLNESDRITRDCVGLISPQEMDTRIENITIHQFDPALGGSVLSILKPVMLTQPDCLIVPDLNDQASMDAIIDHCKKGRCCLTRLPARSAAEALLRAYAVAGDREGFLESVRMATNQRLFRRLCDNCKVPMQVAPKMIQQLGGDPRTQNTLFDQYRLPPPEQRVDEKGRPIEIPPCEVCTGLSFIGRIAAFEFLEVTDEVRDVLRAPNPTVETIEKAARKSGKRSIAAEAYRLVLLGITSVGEVQRMMKS